MSSESKGCTGCGQEFPATTEFFRKRVKGKFGVGSQCHTCRTEYYRKYYSENKSKQFENVQRWRESNRDKTRESSMVRKAAVLQRTPSWLTAEDRKEIRKFYTLAKEAEILTGDSYHVDHIVPLRGGNVSGLHVPWNLQVLPADINIKKGNSYES